MGRSRRNKKSRYHPYTGGGIVWTDEADGSNPYQDLCELYVEWLPNFTTLDDVKRIFGVFGTMKRIKLLARKRHYYGFISFYSQQSTATAFHTLVNQKINESEVTLEYAKPRKKLSIVPTCSVIVSDVPKGIYIEQILQVFGALKSTLYSPRGFVIIKFAAPEEATRAVLHLRDTFNIALTTEVDVADAIRDVKLCSAEAEQVPSEVEDGEVIQADGTAIPAIESDLDSTNDITIESKDLSPPSECSPSQNKLAINAQDIAERESPDLCLLQYWDNAIEKFVIHSKNVIQKFKSEITLLRAENAQLCDALSKEQKKSHTLEAGGTQEADRISVEENFEVVIETMNRILAEEREKVGALTVQLEQQQQAHEKRIEAMKAERSVSDTRHNQIAAHLRTVIDGYARVLAANECNKVATMLQTIHDNMDSKANITLPISQTPPLNQTDAAMYIPSSTQ